MEGSHGRSQSRCSGLAKRTSHAKLALTEMRLSHPKPSNLIPLLLGPLRWWDGASGRCAHGCFTCSSLCVRACAWFHKSSGSSSKLIWPSPRICQTVQANLAERRWWNTNQHSSKGSGIRQILLGCTPQTCIILSIWVKCFPCLPNECIRQIANDATTNERVHRRR